MHIWGDKWFKENGENLEEARRYIGEYVSTHSYYILASKEKWGELVYEHLIPKAGDYMDANLWDTKEGVQVLRKAIESAIKIWPSLEEEIRGDFDDGLGDNEQES